MTPDIERLAKEAGLLWGGDDGRKYLGSGRYDCERDLAEFAHLLAEECAKLVDPDAEHRKGASWGYLGGEEGVELLDAVAKTIRAKFALSSDKPEAK